MRYMVPVILSLICAGTAQAAPVTCPPSIEVAPQNLTHDLPGWNVFIDKVNMRTQLESAAVYNGKPEELGDLVPDESNKKFSQWNLTDNGAQSYYLACRYTSTSVQLTQKLPASFTTCRITYEKDMTINGYGSPQSITCE